MKRKRNGQRTLEASLRSPAQLWHPDVPGPLWNGRRRVGAGQIRAYCRVVAREFQPRKIILFGSYATGSATPDSDVDLVVVMPFRGSVTEQVVAIRGRVEAPFPMDLLVWRPAQQRKTDSFTRGILTEGKVMYEAGDAVKFRYPSHTAARTDAIQALKACRSIRVDIRLSLGLPRK